jgi:hypothetical protein
LKEDFAGGESTGLLCGCLYIFSQEGFLTFPHRHENLVKGLLSVAATKHSNSRAAIVGASLLTNILLYNINQQNLWMLSACMYIRTRSAER